MIDRIRKIIEYEQLNASQFSKKVNINTAVLSHILNGRNNVSLDVVMKIIENCPNINLEWLMTGNGDMIKDSAPPRAGYHAELFAENRADEDRLNMATDYPKEKALKKSEKSRKESDNQPITENNRPNPKIERIVVFYSDKTFEELWPKECL